MAKTHRMVFPERKPSSREISEMVTEYFNARAGDYDEFDTTVEKRVLYRNGINRLVAESLSKQGGIRQVLSVACGPAGRDLEIRKLSGLDYSIQGVDISPEMARVAARNGVETEVGSWLEVDLGSRIFDAAMFLYAFGLVPTSADRERSLRKLAIHLKPGASLFLDFLNVDDANEWGPEIQEIYFERDLKSSGYELGDVFYQKIGNAETSFMHYFGRDEVVTLLDATGFEIGGFWTVGYGKDYGQVLENAKDGAFLVEARRKASAL